jgi:cytochrome c-type biogenesis protein
MRYMQSSDKPSVGSGGEAYGHELDSPRRVDLPVAGMTCGGCATALELGLSEIDGVSRVDVDLKAGRVVVRGDGPDEARLRSTIEALGYTVGAEPEPEGGSRRPGWLPIAAIAAAVVALLVVGTLAFRAASGAYFASGALEGLNAMFAEVSALTVGAAFLFGLAVGFAPSSYAMAPAVMGVVTSAKADSAGRAARLSGAFVAGTVVIDMLVGAAIAVFGSAALAFLGARLALWYALVTVLLVVLALVILRIWRPRLPSFLPRPRRRHTAGGAFAMGLPFGLLTCPACTPLLLPVALGAAATGQPWYGALLLGAFALGRGIPLTVLGTSTGAFQKMRGLTRWVPWIERVVGVLLLVGAAYFAGQFLATGGFPALLQGLTG